MTSAYANKVLRKLAEEKDYWFNLETERSIYVAAEGEEPVVPDYDYENVAGKIAEIDCKVAKIKHAINLNNTTNSVEVGGKQMFIDEILVRMTQLNIRKRILDGLRRRDVKTRLKTSIYSSKKMAAEYEYINYDIETVNADYERVDAEIAEMQLALDKYNQTVEFEVDI